MIELSSDDASFSHNTLPRSPLLAPKLAMHQLRQGGRPPLPTFMARAHRGTSRAPKGAQTRWVSGRHVLKSAAIHSPYTTTKTDIALSRALPPQKFWRGKTDFSCPPSYISEGARAGEGTLTLFSGAELSCFLLLLCLFVSVLAPFPSLAPRRTRLVLRWLRRRASSRLPPSSARLR